MDVEGERGNKKCKMKLRFLAQEAGQTLIHTKRTPEKKYIQGCTYVVPLPEINGIYRHIFCST